MSMGRCVAALALGAGLVLAPAGITQAAEEITVVIPNPSAINVFPLWVAIGEGYFEEEGLTVNVEAVDGSAPVLQAMAAGQAEIGRPGQPRCSRRAPEGSTWCSSTITLRRACSAWSCGRSRRIRRPPISRARPSASAPPTARRWASRGRS